MYLIIDYISLQISLECTVFRVAVINYILLHISTMPVMHTELVEYTKCCLYVVGLINRLFCVMILSTLMLGRS